ncbi:MAG: AAA family ATPase [Candidatus Eisenbacteria bacterium]
MATARKKATGTKTRSAKAEQATTKRKSTAKKKTAGTKKKAAASKAAKSAKKVTKKKTAVASKAAKSAKKTATKKAAAKSRAARSTKKATKKQAAGRKASGARGEKRSGAGKLARPFVERRSLSAVRADTLLHLEERLGRRIVGKNDAVAAIARVVRIAGTNLDFRPERPSGAFLLVGPEGVGKNEVAYAVGEVVFGSDEVVVSIDLSEFDDEESLARLGATLVPGSDSHYFPGVLTAPVRENPEAILLLRGLEHAHPALQRVLLNILERGRLEDLLGEVTFEKTLVFVTLTIPREELAMQEIGFGRPSKTPEARLREVVGRFVMPDLLDSFHEILELPPLSVPEVRLIARYKVDKVLLRMAQKKTTIAVAPSVYDELITDDLCGKGGAKFLNRTLEQRLFNPLARYLLEHRTSREIRVGMSHGDIVIDATAGEDKERGLDGRGDETKRRS